MGGGDDLGKRFPNLFHLAVDRNVKIVDYVSVVDGQFSWPPIFWDTFSGL